MADLPLQALLFAPSQWSRILGEITHSTIRKGTRNYKVGKPVMLCCHLANMCLMADVIKVTQCKLCDLPEMHTVYSDFKLKRLQEFYPNLEMKDNVTQILWANIRGSACGK